MAHKRPRIAIAVEPNLLAGALAEVLTHAGVDELVDIDEPDLDALVTIYLPDSTDADVVIELPDAEGGTGVGRVRTRKGAADVPITGMESILELLDRYCPGRGARRVQLPPS